MQRLAPAVLALALACIAVAPAAAAAPVEVARASAQSSGAQSGSGSPGGTTPAAATLEQCLAASEPSQRSATFYGEMETIPGTWRMAMQIVLQMRTPTDTAFHTVTAPGLGGWQRSETGLKIYKDVRQVTNLPAPALFRVVVQFRWLAEKGRVIKSTARRSAVCREPGSHAKTETTPGTATTPGGATSTGTDTTPTTQRMAAATMR